MRLFRPLGSVAYDLRILSYNLVESTVSLWSLDGRLRILFACGDRQRELLAHQKGESDLALVRGRWYLLATCAVPDAESATGAAMGVDLGIRNTATTSWGTLHCVCRSSAVQAEAQQGPRVLAIEK
jgi:putative transposase